MTEKNEETKEEESKEEEKPEETKEEESAPTVVDDAEKVVTRLEEANKVQKDLLDRQEALAVKKTLGGGSEAGAQPPKPKELTDEEYAEALQRGEVNPLKEDGIIK